MDDNQIKQQVRQFYDQVGWQMVGEDVYQNARYEDLRPVAREYIHKCHLRVNRYIAPKGRFLLDAGSGPVQYPEYLTYSQGYQHRVCLDISIVALQEARKRVGEHGYYVVADVAHLPFADEAFDGFVSLHTLHHLPRHDQVPAYQELNRVLASGHSGVVVNGWPESPLMNRLGWLVHGMEWLGRKIARLRGKTRPQPPQPQKQTAMPQKPAEPTGTFTTRLTPQSLRAELAGKVHIEIYVWRSASVRFLRAVMHTGLGGKLWLRLLYWLEERNPKYYGENGQYPLVVVKK